MEEQDPVHDVLAAEAYAVPAPDPELHHPQPIALPTDPTGLQEPHDVLAAEEFPLPASRPVSTVVRREPRWRAPVGVAAATAAAWALVWLLRRRPVRPR